MIALAEEHRASLISKLEIVVLSLIRSRIAGLYATVGCHPCSAKQFNEYPGGPDAYLDALAEVIEKNLGGKKGRGKVVAIGETGLGALFRGG